MAMLPRNCGFQGTVLGIRKVLVKMKNIEIEIKFHLENPEATRAAIVALGAISLGRFFETNHILDNRGRNLFQTSSLLRLRQADRACLTFKAPPSAPDREFKIREELEVEV